MTGKYESMFREVYSRVPPSGRCGAYTGYCYVRISVLTPIIDVEDMPERYKTLVNFCINYKKDPNDRWRCEYPLTVDVDQSVRSVFFRMGNSITELVNKKKFPGAKKGEEHPLISILNTLSIDKHFELVATLYQYTEDTPENRNIVYTALSALAKKEGL